MTSASIPSHPAPSPAIVKAIRHVLRPLVRLMLASGITYPMVAELLKGIFVEVAERDFRLADRETSDSRVSLISGVHRKDIRRIRAQSYPGESEMPDSLSFGGRLIATWLGDPRFTDEAGNPRALSKFRSDGGSASFEELVETRTKDIRPRAVLDELLRLDIVRVDDSERLILNVDAFIPKSDMDEKLYFFAHNLHDHAATATNNVMASRAPQLERSVIYDSLSEASIDLLARRSRQLGNKLLQDMNRLAMECEAKDAATSGPRQRFTCGVYFFSDSAMNK